MNPPDTSMPAPAFTPPPMPEALPDHLDFRTLMEALLRQPHALVARLAKPGHRATSRFVLLTVVAFLIFGVVLGCFAKHEQLWAAPLKVAGGIVVAGAICFPSLFIFVTLAGSRMSAGQAAACLAGGLALAGLLLLGFAPAVWIFVESTDSFGFMGVLTLGAWLIAVMFGLRFLKAAARAAGATQRGPLFIWSAVFLLVTLQMTTSLRPILGRSDQLLTQEKKFFLQHWGEQFTKQLKPADEKPAVTQPALDSSVSPHLTR